MLHIVQLLVEAIWRRVKHSRACSTSKAFQRLWKLFCSYTKL